MTNPTYSFKQATRVPKGVTADDVMTERDRIVTQYGKASVELSTVAVMSEPKKYPSLRAFGPEDAEEALKEGIARGIRTAYASIIPWRVIEGERAARQEREIRVLHAVPDQEGDIVYERLTIIRTVQSQRNYLLTQVQDEVTTLTNKLQDLIEEMKVVDQDVEATG